MYKKIICILVMMLLISTAISATGITNIETFRNVVKNIELEPSPSNPVDSNGNIAIKIVGEVTDVLDVNNLLGGAILVGDKITGKYIYDSTTPDLDPDPTIGWYEHTSSPYGMVLEAGGFVFETDPNAVNFLMAIFDNDQHYYNGDLYAIISYNNLPLSNGIQVDYMYWFLVDHTFSALSGDALPTAAPVLSDWGENDLFINGYDPTNQDQYFHISATVTKATVSRSQERDVHYTMPPILIWLFERFSNLFPILR